MKLSLLVPVALLLSLPLVGPGPALAQISSPPGAGGPSRLSAVVTDTGSDSSAGDAISSQLVASGADQAQVEVLMGSLQGLANQTTLTALSNAINAFNSIVNSASPEVLASLTADPDFSAIQTLLRKARAALSAASSAD